MAGEFVVRGKGLHSGRDCAVTLRKSDGPVRLGTSGRTVPVGALAVARTDLGVSVRAVGWTIDSVEHLLAAFGGLGVRRGVDVIVEGGEVPLSDGASKRFCEALRELEPPSDPPLLVVSREGVVTVGESVYAFRPSATAALEVTIEFAAPAIGRATVRWDGDPRSFETDFAWARTFGFRSQAAALFAAGRALGAAANSVMILDDEGHVEPPSRPPRDGEFARHKLLDLVGDLYLGGGPPRGEIRARRPGHTATRAALARALAEGIVTRGP